MARPSLGLTRTTIMLNPKHLEFLKKLAKKRNTTYSELVRAAVQEFIRTEAYRLKEDKEKGVTL